MLYYYIFTTFGFTCSLLFAKSSSQSCHPKYQQFPGHSACLPKSPEATTIEITAQMKQHIVDLHNSYRANVTPPAADMLRMSWDDEVAMPAQRWADACDRTGGGLHHDHMRFIPGRFSVGQNLMMGGASFDVAVRAWYYEYQAYTYGTQNDLATTGHYTQVAWAKTYKVGCGVAQCGSTNFYVCNYAPYGNVNPFTEPYETGAQCSKCKTCTDGLCECPGVECNYGVLNSTTCQCECLKQVDFYDKGSCTLNCSSAHTDNYACGDSAPPSFTKDKCGQVGVNQYCPHMCNLCPYADPSYKTGTATSTSASMLVTFVMATIVAVCR